VVLAAAREAVQRARSGGGPSLLEFSTYRYYGHHTFELKARLKYRTQAEIDRWRERDPLDIAAARVPADVRAEVDARIETELDAVVAFAVGSARPDPVDALEYMYTDGPHARAGVVGDA
jgi:pyruvate dehydrogenase E1 component alpha subunit